MKHIVVYHQTGACCYGPVNNGLWQWGDEILVGFSQGVYQPDRGKPPLADASQPHHNVQARSRDGGETWTYETPANLGHGFTSQGEVLDQASVIPLPAEGLNYGHPDFGMRVTGDQVRVTYDRGHCWQGAYQLPNFGLDALTARTAYLADGPQTATLILSGRSASQFAVQSKLADRAFCARTTDGGRSYTLRGWVVPEDPAPRSVCPSLVRLTSEHLLVALRRRRDEVWDGALQRICWIDLYESRDDGVTWRFVSKVADTDSEHLHNGNPPSLVGRPDGRLVCIYGYRSPVYSLRARVSADGGQSWGPELLLRTDAVNFDLGYPRTAARADGQLVTVYWFNTAQLIESHIAATIWHPDEAAVLAATTAPTESETTSA